MSILLFYTVLLLRRIFMTLDSIDIIYPTWDRMVSFQKSIIYRDSDFRSSILKYNL